MCDIFCCDFEVIQLCGYKKDYVNIEYIYRNNSDCITILIAISKQTQTIEYSSNRVNVYHWVNVSSMYDFLDFFCLQRYHFWEEQIELNFRKIDFTKKLELSFFEKPSQ